jgi:hypothetical protein
MKVRRGEVVRRLGVWGLGRWNMAEGFLIKIKLSAD